MNERFGEEYYRESFRLERLRPFSPAWGSVVFYARLCRRLLRRDGGRRLIDLGCAHGHIVARLEDEFETWGADVSAYALAAAATVAPRTRFVRADLGAPRPAELPAGAFDLVLARYVFEHVDRPADALKLAAALLRPGGRLLFAVPDTTSPGRRLKGPRWFAYGDPTHVSLLAPTEWLRLARAAGFTVERAFSDGLWDIPYLRFVPRVLQYALFGLPSVLTVLAARPLLPAGWGENLVVIARRAGEPGGRAGEVRP